MKSSENKDLDMEKLDSSTKNLKKLKYPLLWRVGMSFNIYEIQIKLPS